MRHHTQPIDRLIVHHSASPRSTTLEDIRRWHVDERGWEDVGYHFVIESTGKVHRARPVVYQGAHARGVNDGTIGVCITGNNTSESHRWNRVQVASLRSLIRSLETVFGQLAVFGHRDVASGTECPGLDVRALLVGPQVIEA